MGIDDFRSSFLTYFDEFQKTLSTDAGDWVVKGFIDVYRNIYTISRDTKVISKIIELMLCPVMSRFAAEHNYKMVLSEHQNYYPDISFVALDKTKIALDIKSTYTLDEKTVNGFTLGAFTGYFRDRRSNKNITFPYKQYSAHFILGIIYSRAENTIDELKIHGLDDLQNIISVARNFQFLFHEKWRIASDQPGSGNTKNIGSIKETKGLINGQGPFFKLGEKAFDDYWTNYLTEDMARAIDSEAPYHNLEEYFQWRNRGRKRRRK